MELTLWEFYCNFFLSYFNLEKEMLRKCVSMEKSKKALVRHKIIKNNNDNNKTSNSFSGKL